MEESSNQEENNSSNNEEDEHTKDAGVDHSDNNMIKVRVIQNYPLSLSIDLPFFETFLCQKLLKSWLIT